VPDDRSELVQVQKPDFSPPLAGSSFKVTWIGHASFLVQVAVPGEPRAVNVLLDPVFSERTSPVTFLGPKRYTPTPCSIEELLDAVPIDVVCISHNHYDHADTSTLSTVFKHCGKDVVFCVALGNSRWLTPLGIPKSQIWEADWWDQVDVSLQQSKPDASSTTSSISTSKGSSSLRITCTPCQHASARTPFDKNCDLWCSFALRIPKPDGTHSSIYFSGDTGYRTIPAHPDPYPIEDLDSLPHCPAFAQIGELLGPFDLALLPIGLCHPRHFMSSVHCSAEDSMCIHRDVKAKRSVGMHYGTVRGGLSQYYEDVRLPPKEWKEEAERLKLRWKGESEDWEVGLMDVGECLVI
jgi:N-acyl-phosphatidylethanolamine-hydrolysing phospholipase D